MKNRLFFLLLAVTAGLLAWGTYQALYVAPPEATMGDAQRIFYYHVPAATAASLLFWVNFVASIWYLWKRSPVADAIAVAGAEVGVVFFSVVLISGPIWARYAWGTFWVWDPAHHQPDPVAALRSTHSNLANPGAGFDLGVAASWLCSRPWICPSFICPTAGSAPTIPSP